MVISAAVGFLSGVLSNRIVSPSDGDRVVDVANPRELDCPLTPCVQPSLRGGDCQPEKSELQLCRSLLGAEAARPEPRLLTTDVSDTPEWTQHIAVWNDLSAELGACLESASVEFLDCERYPCVVALRPGPQAEISDVEDEIHGCVSAVDFFSTHSGGVWASEVECPDRVEVAYWFGALDNEGPLNDAVGSGATSFALASMRAAEATPLWDCATR